MDPGPHDGVVVAMVAPSTVVVAQDRRFASVSRRAGDLWAFEDVGPGGVLRLASIELELPLDALYRDALGEIVAAAPA